MAEVKKDTDHAHGDGHAHDSHGDGHKGHGGHDGHSHDSHGGGHKDDGHAHAGGECCGGHGNDGDGHAHDSHGDGHKAHGGHGHGHAHDGHAHDGDGHKDERIPQSSEVIGWHYMYWNAIHPDPSQFKVCFRPGGQFFCDTEAFRAAGTWKIVGSQIAINWKDFGQIRLSVSQWSPLSMRGHVLPKNLFDAQNSRWTIAQGSLSPVEKLLFGDGAGTEWNFTDEKGDTSVEFQCDGENRFVCHQYPEDSHWSLGKNGKTIKIDWGKRGRYELDINVKKKTMEGYPCDADGVPDYDKPECSAELKKSLIAEPTHDDHADHDDHGGGKGHAHLHGEGGHSHGPPPTPAPTPARGHGHNHGEDGHSHGSKAGSKAGGSHDKEKEGHGHDGECCGGHDHDGHGHDGHGHGHDSHDHKGHGHD